MQIVILALVLLSALFSAANFLGRRSERSAIERALRKTLEKTLEQNSAYIRGISEELHKSQASLQNQFSHFALQSDQKLENTRAAIESRMTAMQSASDGRLEKIQRTLAESLQKMLENARENNLGIQEQFKNYSMQSEQKLENIRRSTENSIRSMQESNEKRLEAMQGIVHDKLQETLNTTLQNSFAQVSARLEQVHKGLGEMQALAAGVGDLKKVLSGVKTRGILGEIQLGAILEQMLSPEQYDKNVETKKGSKQVVEFAIKLPGQGKAPVYLPVDAKFPLESYQLLQDAYDGGDAPRVEAAAKEFSRAVRVSARDIHDKYISPPETTDFGIMFFPIEGLYAEVVRSGAVERLQNEFKIVVAGPTTMAALLNSLQMGFRTLAIQKRSGEVWNILQSVKTEFVKYSKALEDTQKSIDSASSKLKELSGTRTNQMLRKLEKVEALPEQDSLTD
ncbi:MAG: DNA recombination protein RmuC [Oscillospiraceae bacterium]|jgi:DNA recombination protein RmuC|nr:DNA recombination protein RmuC [Oscillospiraceae bacterium]